MIVQLKEDCDKGQNVRGQQKQQQKVGFAQAAHSRAVHSPGMSNLISLHESAQVCMSCKLAEFLAGKPGRTCP